MGRGQKERGYYLFVAILWLSCGYHDGEQQKRTPPCVSTASVLFCFFRMAQGLRGNGRYIKKENVIRGAGRISSSGMSMKKLCDFK